jgi:hypothetical protein
MTQCLSCKQASPHEARYHFLPPGHGEARETRDVPEATGRTRRHRNGQPARAPEDLRTISIASSNDCS